MNKLDKIFLESKIKEVEYVEHTSVNGKILRWAVFNLENGYAVAGKPSVCVDPKNDNEVVGRQIAYDNGFEELWALEGYLLQEKLNSTN